MMGPTCCQHFEMLKTEPRKYRELIIRTLAHSLDETVECYILEGNEARAVGDDAGFSFEMRGCPPSADER